MKKSRKVKKSLSLLRLIVFLLVVSGILYIGAGRLKGYITERFYVIEQGTITVNSFDHNNELPITGTKFAIVEGESGEVIEILITDLDGKATSSLLDYGLLYEVRQIAVPHPYDLDDGIIETFELNEENYEILTNNRLLEHIKDIERTENGEIVINEVFISVPTVMQKPELPNGCEITSLTAVLNYYGYDVSKTTMADQYLRKLSFNRIDGKLYGADPYIAFSGNPRDPRAGFFVYAPPIVDAADDYLKEIGVNHHSKDISGSSIVEIYEYLNNGSPVVIWTSIDQQPIRFDYSWYLFDTGELFKAATNLHAVVLNGYFGDKVHVMDPLKGQVIYDRDVLFEGYFSLDSQAMIVY